MKEKLDLLGPRIKSRDQPGGGPSLNRLVGSFLGLIADVLEGVRQKKIEKENAWREI
jgi:hypothetical protein